MILIDTSAWVEYFHDGDPGVTAAVDNALAVHRVVMGDLVYCEVMQGLRVRRDREAVADMFSALPRVDLVGFANAEKAAANYRRMRSRGVTVRKIVDVLIATFCAENGYWLIHHDRDFDLMAPYIPFTIFSVGPGEPDLSCPPQLPDSGRV